MLKAFAGDLKHIREEKNISLKDISNKTRLNITILEALESGDFTFQPQTYIRAFLKQYIAALDIDVDEFLFDYDLARSGKYKQKFIHKPDDKAESSETQNEESAKIEKPSLKEKFKGIVDTPKKFIQEKKTEQEDKSSDVQGKTSESTVIPDKGNAPEHKTGNRMSINPNDSKTSQLPVRDTQVKKSPFSFLASPVFKNIFTILFILLVVLGLYSLINILFLEGKNDKPEIIRQNFDEVVQEQEKKILGKKTPEEINDSIRKANEEALAKADSVTLKITSLSKGMIFLSYDSANYSNPDKISFEEGETGTFKAARFFHISSGNTGSFKAVINNNPLSFKSKSISKVKISKNGIEN